MIRVGIIGADKEDAGELIRLLVHHPEVELNEVIASEFNGKRVNDIHYGLVGDTDVRFSNKVNTDNVDIIFVTDVNAIPESFELTPELKIVLSDTGSVPASEVSEKFEGLEFVEGLSEMFRKPLVRGARAAKVLPSPVAVTVIALFPLAAHLLLNNDVKIDVTVPKYALREFPDDLIKETTENILKKAQTSFKQIKEMNISKGANHRALTVDIEFPCSVSLDEILKVYENIYDDHNFTFVVDSLADPSDVAGTHKCLIHVEKPDEDTLRIHALADGILRGGAGDAIHAMNLLFGLFEKTGLNLPASYAFNREILQ